MQKQDICSENCARKKVRLLVVRDQDNYSDLLQEHVELNRHLYEIEYRIVASGHEGLRLIPAWMPSLVVVDAYIEDINSFDFLKKCKEMEVPVAVIGDSGSNDIEKSLLRNGAAAYFKANEDPDSLDRLLSELVSLAGEPERSH